MMYGDILPQYSLWPTKRPIHEAEKVGWLYPTSSEKQAEASQAAITGKTK